MTPTVPVRPFFEWGGANTQVDGEEHTGVAMGALAAYVWSCVSWMERLACLLYTTLYSVVARCCCFFEHVGMEGAFFGGYDSTSSTSHHHHHHLLGVILLPWRLANNNSLVRVNVHAHALR